MEAYARHSRFHSRAPPPPHFSAGAEAATYKNGFMAYDDVFGGAPKFGATAPFAPRAEDYSEIFGSFRSSRASSIPMLDLPPVDDSVAAFDVVGCSGFGYHEIFGGFGFADFAVSYDELFRRSDGSEESSDDAWTPVGSQSLSEESDPSACSGRNQYFLSDDFHQTHDNELNVSCREPNLETAEDSDCKHGTQLSDVPGYSYVVEGPSLEMQDKEVYSSGVADDIVLCEDSSGNILVETKTKTSSDLCHDFDQNAGRAPGIGLSPHLESVSDVSLAAGSSDLPSPPRVPTKVVDRKKDPLTSTSNYEHAETLVDSGSFDFFDVEIDASGSSAPASEVAVKEAMERSKVKMRKAKELVEIKNDTNGHEVVRIVSNESTSRDDEPQSTYGSKPNLFETSEKAMHYASEASQGSPDCLQVENGINGAAKPSHIKNVKEEQSPVQKPGITEEAGDWKVAAQYYELVNDCNPKIEPALLDNGNKFAQMDDYYLGNASAKTMPHKQPKQDVEGVNTSIEENGDSKSAREACDPRKNRRRLRATKAASRQNFHERMVKVAQVVDETVTFGQMKSMKEGVETDGADRSLRGFDQSAQQVRHERKHREEYELAENEMRSKEDVVEAFSKKNEIGTSSLEEGEVHGMGLNAAHQTEEKEEVCTRKETEARKRVDSPVIENLAVLNVPLENGEDAEKSGRDKKQNSGMQLKWSDEECREREDEIWGKEASDRKVKEAQKTDQFKETVDEATMADCCESKVKGSVEPEKDDKKLEGSDGTTNKETENEISEKEGAVNTTLASEFEKHQKIYEDSAVNGGQKMDHKADMQSELKSNEQNSYLGAHLHVEPEFTSSIGSCAWVETNDKVSEVNCELEELQYSNSAATPDEKYTKPTTAAFECKVKPETNAAEDTIVVEAETEADEDICISPKHFQNTEAAQPMTSLRKESLQKHYVSSDLNHRFEEDGKAINGNIAAEDRGKAENSKRGDETERKHLRELELEREKEQISKQEEERERERVKELEKLRLRRLEELRERERERELEKFRLRNLEEERQREREKDLEIERQRKLEEEWERQREREKDRMGMELKTSLAREKAEKVAAEREAVESRQRAMAEARERLEKACAEARGKSLSERASAEARLRAERAAVERAAAEARERAIGKAMAERATFERRERVERSVSEKFSSTIRDERLRHCSSSSDLWNSDKSYGVEGESAQRSKARMERHRRTVERVAKALAEKNTRDLVAQREQAERSRLAETLDGDIKRWSNGKEGNLRALLSTLQYILGPDGGWQPIPLTEVITSAAVKKAYRKATLCVHPDKLQQRGATIQQKYICEKVFDLLKEAWNKFNSEER